ncbi:DUF945 family protein [Emcibacter sp.]|uniref:DUF945 family protein n=1 Tax=Emcibacter sp. TaxID=1979954 RepID=UPI002AA7D656|nr:DUF945 family protein [Emcibacter sp.]
MNKKRIIWASVGVVLVIILGILPWFFGNMAHNKLEEQAATISEIPGYALTIREYDQGWFSSRALITYGFDQHMLDILEQSEQKSEMDQMMLELFRTGAEFEVDIAHGPVTFQNGISFALLSADGSLKGFDTDGYRDFQAQAAVPGFLNVEAEVSYLGATTLDMTSPKFTAVVTNDKGQEITITSGGLATKTTFSADITHYDTEGEMPLFTVTGTGETFILKKLSFEGSGDKVNDFIWLGEGETELGELSLTGPQGSFVASNFEIEYDLEQAGDNNIDFGMTLRLPQFLFAPDDNKITGLDLKDILVDMSLNRLDEGALTDYVKGIKQLTNNMNVGSPEEQQQIQMQTLQVINDAGRRLLLNSPELDIRELAFKMDGGSFDGDGMVKINAEGLDNAMILSMPGELTKRLDLDLTARFDQPLAEAFVLMGMKKQMAATGIDMGFMPPEQLKEAVSIQTSLMLQTYAQQGLIVAGEEKNTYQTRIQIKDGQQMVNGKAIQLPMGQ